MKSLPCHINKDKIILYCDRIIFAFLCFLIFCLPFAKAGVEVFVWNAFFLWLLKRVLGYRAESFWKMLPKTELNNALGLLMITNIISLICSVNFGLSLRGFLGKELKFLVIYFMLVEAINTKKRLKYVLIAIIASAILVMVDAGVQYFTGVDFLRGYKLSKLRACFANPNGFAGWLIVIILLFLGLISKKDLAKKIKILLLPLILTLLICLVMTYSRGAWVGFLVGILLMVYYVFKNASLKIKIFYLFSLLLLFVFLSYYPPIKIITVKVTKKISNKLGQQSIENRVKSILSVKDRSNSNRFYMWKEGLMMVEDSPLFGFGLNTYSRVAPLYKIPKGGGIYPHNSYVQKAAETGIIGLLAFLWVLFTFFEVCLKNINEKKNYLVLGFFCGIVAFLVHAFFDTHLYALQLVVLFWYMLGLTMAVIKLDSNEKQSLQCKPNKI